MPHQLPQAEPDVARVLVSGISGIHPRDINGYALFTVNGECGVHLTTNACCAYHAVQRVMAAWNLEASELVPCSDGLG